MKEEDIQAAIKEAEAHAEEDKKHKELVETKNQGDNLVYGLEKLLKESGDKISEDDKKKLTDAIEKAKKDFESDDIEVVKKAIDELTNASNGIVSKMYQSANPNGNNGQNGNGQGGENGQNGGNDGDPVVDVD